MKTLSTFSPTRLNLHFSESDPNPGPTHNPTDPYLYKGQTQPKYSLGKKSKVLGYDSGPGPNTDPTPVDAYKHRAPQYQMFAQIETKIEDKGPAANSYDITNSSAKVMRQNPAYTMFGRVKDSKNNSSPGPGKYDLASFKPFGGNPVYSMGLRHSEYAHVPVLPMDNC